MSDAPVEPQWYCIKCRPRQEQVARRWLAKEGLVEVFCPLVRFERARASGKVRVTEAMFPGYLFGRFHFAELHRQVRAANGVSTIVSFGGEPAIVAPEIITELRAMVSSGELVEIPATIQPGEEVSVIEGPFCGIRAVVTQVLPARARVKVLLELLGIEREVEISESSVLPDFDHPLVHKAD